MSKLHKVTVHHVRAIHGRMALMGVSQNELATRVGVSKTTVGNILRGDHVATRHLPAILEVLGMDPASNTETLRREHELFNAMRALLVAGEPLHLHLAATLLGALATQVIEQSEVPGIA